MRVISSCWLRPCPLYTPPVAPTDWVIRWIIWTAVIFGPQILQRKIWWTLSLRGRRSRNKVSVGEPAEGSVLGRGRTGSVYLIGTSARIDCDQFLATHFDTTCAHAYPRAPSQISHFITQVAASWSEHIVSKASYTLRRNPIWKPTWGMTDDSRPTEESYCARCLCVLKYMSDTVCTSHDVFTYLGEIWATMNDLARSTLKNVAKCNILCDLWNFEKGSNVERKRRLSTIFGALISWYPSSSQPHTYCNGLMCAISNVPGTCKPVQP